MRPLTLSTVVHRPAAEVYDYLVDVANHLEFTDHYADEFRLTRLDPVGVGAGARFRLPMPFNRFDWAELSIVEVEAPARIVLHGQGGKFNRTRMRALWELEPTRDGTKVTWTFETRPKLPSDTFVEKLGFRSSFRRKQKKALNRLRSILERGEGRGKRATVAGSDARGIGLPVR